MKEDKLAIKKKIKLYEKLGARNFQSFVFKIEDIKWKVIKKVFPNYLKFVDKMIDKKTIKFLKRAKTEDIKDKIKMITKIEKMKSRKEYNRTENINYHISKSNPTDFLYYLNWNKSIHKKGLIKDLILLPITIIAITNSAAIAIPLVIYNLSSLFINFQCINLQNYNISRISLIKEKLEKQEKKKIENDISNYGDAINLVSNTIKDKENIPTIEDIVNNIKTKAQAEQLKQLILREKLERENNKKNIKGGKQYGINR